MVDSRQKGSRAELDIAKKLSKDTPYEWKRVPSSGALHESHGLKGDIYIPQKANVFSVEVKHYKESQFNTKILTDKAPIFLDWWKQAVRQAEQTNKLPLLFFKHDRSKWFVCGEVTVMGFWRDASRAFVLYPEDIVVLEYSEFIKYCIGEMVWVD